MFLRNSALRRYRNHRKRSLRFESLHTRQLMAADTISGLDPAESALAEPVQANELLPAVQKISSFDTSGSSFVIADAIRVERVVEAGDQLFARTR